MMIDLVSTLRRGVDVGEALGLSNETCGQSARALSTFLIHSLAWKPTFGLTTVRSVVHREHEKLIETLML